MFSTEILINAAVTGNLAAGAPFQKTLGIETERKGRSSENRLEVRLLGVPDGLEDYPDLPTKTAFEKCIGHEFVVAGFNEVGMAELGIQSVTGYQGETIWVEIQYLELVSK